MEIEKDVIKQLYFQMLRIRLVEEKIAERYLDQEMRCPVHLCIGQEAIAVGVSANLVNNDYVLSTHRSHAHYLAKGGNLGALLSELYGKVTGCSRGKGGSMHLVDISVSFLAATPIVGATIPIAVGAAFSTAMRGEPRVTIIYFGDAAVEEGVFHESINFASLKQLPIVFVCENNLFSVYSPLSVRQPKRPIIDLALGHGVEAHQGDGNNVIEVYQMGKNAIDKARQGRGPTFLEFSTYRYREHCGPKFDNDLGYRSQEQFEDWVQQDPIKKLKELMVKEKIVDKFHINEITQQIQTEIQQAFDFAINSPFPDEYLLFENVYAP